MGVSHTDGDRAVYADPAGNLFFGDLVGDNKRMIFKAEPGDRPGWVPSRDFSTAYLTLKCQYAAHHPRVLCIQD
jgi:hypothetical protein